MMNRIGLVALVCGLVVGLIFVSQAISQQDTGQEGGGAKAAGDNGGEKAASRGQRGGFGGNFDPAQFRQRMMDELKGAMGATDDEWKVLQPKIEKVQTLAREQRAGGMMGLARGGFGGRGQGGPGAPAQPADNQPQSEIAKAADALNKVLENKDASQDDIKTALQALRDARAKAKADLEAAQKDLKSVLTVRQEAVLVARNILE